jgi:hypothetical protein
MIIQDNKNLHCDSCGNTRDFKDFTHRDDVYRHVQCPVCNREIIASKNKK